ncbi:COMM domain-containing protein 7-like [Lineus longissimus]|uniref:COMM domain-containing protein 7-like n=1 Tax=Lineus longissimus TaxID=88925 RepID=UPI002B4EE65D
MASTFHFSQETPPDSMFSDIQTINKFQDEQFRQLSGVVFSFLIEPSKSSRLLSQLEEFASEHGVPAGPLKNVIKSLLTIPNSALKKNLSPTHLKEDLVNLGLSEEKASHFSEQYKTNLVALSRSALGQTLMVNQLVDMEWKFGVTAASSELDKVGNTFLQLKLVINKGSNKTENVYMELSLPQFYSFLHEMEKAKASLDFFS